MKASELFSFPDSLPFSEFFDEKVDAWEWIKAIGPALEAHEMSLLENAIPEGVHIEGDVFIDPTVKLPAYATIIGPAYIGPEVELRPGVYIRGNVIVGRGCVLGNACEFKNTLLLDNVKVPHFSYVGDSILGNGAHLGAGVILSNFRLDQQLITINLPDRTAETGLRKMGALLGDGAEVGCNAVLQPGTIIGRRSLVYPLTAFGGVLEREMIVGTRPAMRTIPRRD
ncbi:MAG: UDP-N-acetylglucosamine diphosphorylase [Opitutaceae bacterium]|nr:UDP-N-acetylglucosamine diphosphorylase [Opitutaceae bacterium]